jgi:hypothetical protein
VVENRRVAYAENIGSSGQRVAIYAYDLDPEAEIIVSSIVNVVPPNETLGKCYPPPSIPELGNRIAYSSAADDLVENDSNGVRDIFVWFE